MSTATKTKRLADALSALQAQSSAAVALLPGESKTKGKADRSALKEAQARMVACEPETSRIWKFVMSGKAGKPIPDLTIADLESLISEPEF